MTGMELVGDLLFQAQPEDVRKTGAFTGQRSCVGLPTSYISIRQGIVFSCKFLNHVSHAILYCATIVTSLARAFNHDFVDAQLQYYHLFEAWLIFSLLRFFDQDPLAIDWNLNVKDKPQDMAGFLSFHNASASTPVSSALVFEARLRCVCQQGIRHRRQCQAHHASLRAYR